MNSHLSGLDQILKQVYANQEMVDGGSLSQMADQNKRQKLGENSEIIKVPQNFVPGNMPGNYSLKNMQSLKQVQIPQGFNLENSSFKMFPQQPSLHKHGSSFFPKDKQGIM
jgi:hypothetical protein